MNPVTYFLRLFGFFAAGFVGGYLLMAAFLFIIIRLGHVLLWLLLLAPMALGIVFGLRNVKARSFSTTVGTK